MPLGFHVIPNIGRIGTDFALSGFTDPAGRATQLIGLFAEAFNPIGSAGWSLQTLAPSVFDPAVALAENRDWSGRPIYRENFSSLDPKPGHQRTRDTASAFSRGLSYAFNVATGGTDYKPGAFSPTPDQIDYLIGQAFGGVGREAMKGMVTATALIEGADLPPHRVPLLGRFYGDADSPSSQSTRFYDNLLKRNMHRSEIRGRREAREPIDEYLAANPEARLARMGNAIYQELGKLRKRRRELEARGEDGERLKRIDDRITGLMTRFNERVKAVQ